MCTDVMFNVHSTYVYIHTFRIYEVAKPEQFTFVSFHVEWINEDLFDAVSSICIKRRGQGRKKDEVGGGGEEEAVNISIYSTLNEQISSMIIPSSNILIHTLSLQSPKWLCYNQRICKSREYLTCLSAVFNSWLWSQNKRKDDADFQAARKEQNC